MKAVKFHLSCVALAALLTACASAPTGNSSQGAWTDEALAAALSAPSRPQADRDRDADRKPAQLMTFFGIERGMTAIDVIAAQGYMTEVLATAVGPTGKVYLQNPDIMLQMNNGAAVKSIVARLEGNRLPNVARVDGNLPNAAVAPGSVDAAITVMNLHDVYNRGAPAAQGFLKSVYDVLKPGGVLGVVDHVGIAGANNTQLHRMTKQQAVEALTAAGFTIEAESNVLANAQDDHSKGVFDPQLRGKTDQFVIKARKPK
jgi:predicted methyltransferase